MIVFIAPIFYWILNAIMNGGSLSDFFDYGLIIFVSMFATSLFSLPTFLIIHFVILKFENRNVSPIHLKIITSIIGSIGVLITFASLDFSLFKSVRGLLMPISFLVSIICASFLFNTDNNYKNSNSG